MTTTTTTTMLTTTTLTTMPERIKKREPVLFAAALGLRDLAPRIPRIALSLSLSEGFLDDYYFLSRTHSRARAVQKGHFSLGGKETYGTNERGWNMRCGRLIYLRGRPDIRFVELRFKSGRGRRTDRYKQRRTTGACERAREATTWNESA